MLGQGPRRQAGARTHHGATIHAFASITGIVGCLSCSSLNPDFNDLGPKQAESSETSRDSNSSSEEMSSTSLRESSASEAGGGSEDGTNTSSADWGRDSDTGSLSDSDTSTSSTTASEDSSGQSGTESGGGSDGSDPLFCQHERDTLVACFDFDELEGGSMIDGSGQGNHIALQNPRLVDDGRGGRYLAADHELIASVADSGSLDVARMTTEVHFMVDRAPIGVTGLIDNEKQYAVYLEPDTIVCTNVRNSAVYRTPLILGQWRQVVCTADDRFLRLYVDGMLVDEVPEYSLLPTTNDDAMAVGNMSPFWGDPLVGGIDQLRIWSRAFAPSEVADLFGDSVVTGSPTRRCSSSRF